MYLNYLIKLSLHTFYDNVYTIVTHHIHITCKILLKNSEVFSSRCLERLQNLFGILCVMTFVACFNSATTQFYITRL